MSDFFISLGVWNWLILGAVFLLLEVLAPGTFMLWLGIAALLVGGISMFVVWPWQYQLVAFAVFALAAIPLWRRIARGVETPVDQPFLNRRADAFVGREFTLEKPIVAGTGTVRIDDTIWRLSGPDCAAGSRVKVVRADAALLVVEPIQLRVPGA
jgi:membrane protein implicated in regulation of membrane protease activity